MNDGVNENLPHAKEHLALTNSGDAKKLFISICAISHCWA